jgi:hypothetical protein
LSLFVLFGLCNFPAIGRVVVIFVTIVTPHFGLLFFRNVTSTYTTGKGSVIIYCYGQSWSIRAPNLV